MKKRNKRSDDYVFVCFFFSICLFVPKGGREGDGEERDFVTKRERRKRDEVNGGEEEIVIY